MIAEAKCLNLPDEVTAKFPRHAALARELLSADPRERPTAAGVLRRWPRVNLRLGDGAANGLAGARVALPRRRRRARRRRRRSRRTVASGGDGGGPPRSTRSRATRTQSLPETDLAAIADAVRAAAEMTTARRSPSLPATRTRSVTSGRRPSARTWTWTWRRRREKISPRRFVDSANDWRVSSGVERRGRTNDSRVECRDAVPDGDDVRFSSMNTLYYTLLRIISTSSHLVSVIPSRLRRLVSSPSSHGVENAPDFRGERVRIACRVPSRILHLARVEI